MKLLSLVLLLAFSIQGLSAGEKTKPRKEKPKLTEAQKKDRTMLKAEIRREIRLDQEKIRLQESH